MRFDEPETREAYRRGAQDLLECIQAELPKRKLRELQKWLSELDAWEEFDPPAPPPASLR
jgi:hypothetical protein